MRRRTLLITAALVGIMALFGPFGDLSGATEISVSNEAEYRGALDALSGDPNGPHTITVTADIAMSGSGDPTYDGSQTLTIEGNGHTFTGGNIFTGSGITRFLQSESDADLTVEDLTITGFVADDFPHYGGAIEVLSETATLTVRRSTFNENGEQSVSSVGSGGALYVAGSLVVEDSTFSSNFAGLGGAIYGGVGSIDVTGSTFNENGALRGGAIYTEGSDVRLINSTLVDNIGLQGGAVNNQNGDVALTYTTIYGNDAPQVIALGALSSFGSVIAWSGESCVVGPGGTTSAYSYEDTFSCGFAGTGDTAGGEDNGLGGLSDNGGPTQTMAIGTNSPLFDAIPAAACGTVTVDQRGQPRPGDRSSGCDIGAFELQADPPQAAEPPPEEPPAGEAPATPADAGPIRAAPPFTG